MYVSLRFSGFIMAFLHLSLFAQNVGIGTTSPLAKLHIKATNTALRLENTTTLTGKSWNVSSTNLGHFQVSDQNLALTRLHIESSNGNVGIGNTTPTQKLHVTGNFRLDNAFMPNNSAGNLGEVLVSQGAGVAPQWKPIGNVIQVLKANATRTLITSTVFAAITGLTNTFTLTTNAIVIVSTYGSLETTSSSSGGSGCIVQVFSNGVAVPDMFQTIDVNDAAGVTNTIHPWAMTNTLTLAAGTYTITVRARKYAFDNFYAGGNTTAPTPNEGALILTIIPQ
ncbi:MAG: hypothetical protein ACKVTZ_16130 [Bacteroidia bacterium]